jgi:hypothetical protein
MKPIVTVITHKERKRQPGEVPLHRIPVVDHKGNVRGHVGERASAATAARFIGRPGMELKDHEGRQSWVADKPPPKPKPQIVVAPAAAPAAKPDANKAAAKGSVTKHPDKPKTHVRPRS